MASPANPANPAGRSPIKEYGTLHNVAGRVALLNELGLIVAVDDIVSFGFTFTSRTDEELIREFNQSGIFYSASEKIASGIRVYLQGAAPIVARSMGIEVQSEVIMVEEAVMASSTEDEEENEGNEGEEGDRVVQKVIHTPVTVHYVEYVLAITTMDSMTRPIQSHPRFIELFEKSEKNGNVLSTKLTRFSSTVARYGGVAQTEVDEDLDEENDGLQPRINESVLAASADAHRREQANIRQSLDAILDYFDERIIADGAYQKPISLTEVKNRFKEMETEGLAMGSADQLLLDLSKEVTYL